MGDFDPSFVQALAVQSWSLYSIGMFLILLRTYARIHRLGLKGLQVDDYLMLLAGSFYTILIVCLNVISGNGGSNLYLPEEFATFTPLEIKERIHGSKIVIVSEQAMLNVIYTIKACMLIMYSRLTLGHKIQKMVFYLSIYVAVGWFATEIAFFIACRPFNGYWAMPPPNAQCTTLQHYAIVQACFNITSDCLMLCIPIPLIRKLQMPLKQKAVLLLIFSMGIFVILAALLTKIFNLSNIWDPSYMLWYTRESSVAVYVSNIPMIWPLLREWFPVLLSMTPGHKLSSSTKKGRGYGKGGTNTGGRNNGTSRIGDAGRGIVTTIRGQGDSMEKLDSRDDETEMGPITRQESWGRSDKSDIGLSDRGMRSGIWDGGLDLKGGIQIQTTVEVIEDFVVHPGHEDISRDLEKGPGNIQWNFEQDEKK